MQIKNTGDRERSVSRDGVAIPLMPGAAVEFPLTEDEANAFRGIGFELTGEAAKAEKKGKGE